MAKSNRSKVLTLPSPWKTNRHKIRLATSLKLIRNINPYKFPEKLNVSQKVQIKKSICKKLLSVKSLETPFEMADSDLSPLEKEFLYERFLLTDGLQRMEEGEGVILDKKGNFLAVVNQGSHLQLQLIDHGDELEASLARLVEIEVEAGKELNFAFSKRFGFLTSEAAHCGTGFQVHMFLHVPALMNLNRLQLLLDEFQVEGVIPQGMQGSPDDYIGDVLVLRNKFTLGVSEEGILESLNKCATKVIYEERSARSKLGKEASGALKDQVGRAFGLLQHSYKLDTIEAMNALSLLKLGVDLEWVKGVTIEKLNELFFDVPRAHLSLTSKEEVPHQDTSKYRALYLHKALSKMKLSLN